MNVIEIKELTKQFEYTTALDNVSFSIERGSVFGIIGPNGAGKTTLLRVLNAITTFDKGSVQILGQPASLRTSERMGYMPEERGLYENMTVAQQIQFFGELKGGNPYRIRQVMYEYIDLFELKGQEGRRIRELSKGNQQKVQIIATICHEPEVVILDEPFSGFDPINGELLIELIERLHNAGTTIIISSHNMAAVEELCDSIALIDHGKLLLNGNLSEIKETHKSNQILLTTSTAIDLAVILGIEGVANADVRQAKTERRGFHYLITKEPEASNSAILSQLAPHAEILKFEEALPSLHSLFLKYTQQ